MLTVFHEEKPVRAILDQINGLSEDQKQKILNEAKPNVLMVFSGSSVINHGVSIQINGNSEDINKALEKIPLEPLGELLKAIGSYLIKNPI